MLKSIRKYKNGSFRKRLVLDLGDAELQHVLRITAVPFFFFFLSFGATAPSVPGPPHLRGF
jgi:hypothetical protein